MISSVRGSEALDARAQSARPSPHDPLSLEVACARLAILGEHLMAEGSAQGGVRTLIPADRIRFLPRGGLEITPPRPDEPRSEEARDLSYALGVLLYTWLTGVAPPRRATMSIAHERVLRRSLANAELDGEATELLRRLLAWDPVRRPWPEVAIAQLRVLAGPALDLCRPPEIPPEDLATERAQLSAALTEEIEPSEPSELSRAEERSAAVTANFHDGDTAAPPALPARFSVADDHELLFFPEVTSPEPALPAPLPPVQDVRAPVLVEEPVEEEDPFSIPDHTTVVPFPYRHEIGLGPSSDDEATDPELYKSASEDDRTDPEGSQAMAAHLHADDTGPRVLRRLDARSLGGETLPAVALQPVPAPVGVRLEEGPSTSAPQRNSASAPRKTRSPSLLVVFGFGALLLAGVALLLR